MLSFFMTHFPFPHSFPALEGKGHNESIDRVGGRRGFFWT